MNQIDHRKHATNRKKGVEWSTVKCSANKLQQQQQKSNYCQLNYYSKRSSYDLFAVFGLRFILWRESIDRMFCVIRFDEIKLIFYAFPHYTK